jgi:hypothetical protein
MDHRPFEWQYCDAPIVISVVNKKLSTTIGTFNDISITIIGIQFEAQIAVVFALLQSHHKVIKPNKSLVIPGCRMAFCFIDKIQWQ